MFKIFSNVFHTKKAGSVSSHGDTFAQPVHTNFTLEQSLKIRRNFQEKTDALNEQKKREKNFLDNPQSAKQKNIQHAMLKVEERKKSDSRPSTPTTETGSFDDDYDYNYDSDANTVTKKQPARFVEISEGDIKLKTTPTLEELEKEYRENSRTRCLPSLSYFWNKNAFFGTSADVNKTIETLKARAELRPEGTSAKTLNKLGLK